jgi:hypothetical protein
VLCDQPPEDPVEDHRQEVVHDRGLPVPEEPVPEPFVAPDELLKIEVAHALVLAAGVVDQALERVNAPLERRREVAGADDEPGDADRLADPSAPGGPLERLADAHHFLHEGLVVSEARE